MKCVAVSVKDSTLSRVALRPPLALGKGVKEHQRPDHSAHIEGVPQGVLEVAQVLSPMTYVTRPSRGTVSKFFVCF